MRAIPFPSAAACRRRRGLYLLQGALLLLAAAGCTPLFRPFPRLAPQVDCSRPSLVFFFVDGLDCVRLHQMLAAGELPNIQKRFVDGGVEVRHAVSSVPSITYPNCSALITGRFPGHHGIMGNYWFDRYTLFARYYMTLDTYRTVNEHLQAPTLYDALHDQYTFNIQDHTRKGVTRTIDNRGTFETAWIIGRYSLADLHVGDSMIHVIEAANRAVCWPRVVMTYYPGVDEIGHRSGSQSPQYGDAVRNIDRIVGYVTRELEAAGLGDTLYYALVTDHSHPPVSEHLDILKWLTANRGLALRTKPVLYANPCKRVCVMEGDDAVANVDAGRFTMVSLKSPKGWSQRLTPDEMVRWITREPSLLDVPAVEMVATRAGPDRVRLLSRAGTAVVERRAQDGLKQYRVVEQKGDVLNAQGRPEYSSFIARGWHASREWLAASAEERYPDLVPQIVEMFDSPHTGDAGIFAAQGWSFAFGPAENGGHGSCLASDMHVPMMFSGPGLPKGASIEYARLVDVTPTVLGLVGEAGRIKNLGEIDGIDLADQLRRAR
jgi:hypothetical protein